MSDKKQEARLIARSDMQSAIDSYIKAAEACGNDEIDMKQEIRDVLFEVGRDNNVDLEWGD